MNLWLSCIVGLAATWVVGCLPSPIGDPTTSRIDAALEGTWLHDGLELAQCAVSGVEYGPGRQQTIYLVKAFDEHCYLVTAISFYAAKDGRLSTFGPGGAAGLAWWKAWLAPLGDRRYLVCQNLAANPFPNGPAFEGFPTFDLERPDADTVRLTPVVFADIFKHLEGATPGEAKAIIAAEYSREKLESRIRENPAAAAPGDPRPLLLERMKQASRPLVKRVLAAYHLVDSRRARQPEPAVAPAAVAPAPRLDGPYDIRTIPEDLTRPTEFSETPGPGKVVMDQITNPKFFPSGRPASPNALQGHAVYLPTNWEPGKKHPVVFEYLGNTVGVQSLKGIGYGLTGGRDFIWVILPIVSEFPATQPDVEVNWGAGGALSNAVAYAKQAVREVCEKWGGDRNNCILMGYSRGGIACNLIGLYDDEIASLWKAMVPGAHYFHAGLDITGTKIALGGADYKEVAAKSIARLGRISQLCIAEYNTNPLNGNPDTQLVPKIEAAGCTTIGEAIAAFKLEPIYDSSQTKTRELIAAHKPATSEVTFYPLPWVNHGSTFSLRPTPAREFIRNWLRVQVGLPPGED